MESHTVNSTLDNPRSDDQPAAHPRENKVSDQDSIDSVEGTSPGLSRVGDKFEPLDLEKAPAIHSGLPPEIWTITQSVTANFAPQYFLDVSRNLLENPNLTASHLSRAEISYKSFTDASFNPTAQHAHDLASIIKHMKADHQPRLIPGGIPGYTLEWTVVRKLIPRNPNLDKPLMQTCHLYTSTARMQSSTIDGGMDSLPAERYLIIYIPHTSEPDEIPFYHPKVRGLAILYTYTPTVAAPSALGQLSIFYDLFSTKPLDNRLSRTALKMLEIIHKHARGRAAGYQKRVHHDVIIPQKQFQDTYTYLKGKYVKFLMENWVEQTPANKHVFEDLGIAAFLVELWKRMYGGEKVDVGVKGKVATGMDDAKEENLEADSEWQKHAQHHFPGFVDIGCGNGILVWILNQEGWSGWGFDARSRKTWDIFPAEVKENLKAMLLIPSILTSNTKDSEADIDKTNNDDHSTSEGNVAGISSHNGVFPAGTFIISNHADELTPWTPLLAYLNSSPFIAIPCCSHDLGGTRFRAPYYPSDLDASHNGQSGPLIDREKKKSANKPQKPPSAYASLCSYVTHLTSAVGFKPEKEHLRIPSTRNIAILGQKRGDGKNTTGRKEEARVERNDEEDRLEVLRSIVEREMKGCEGGIEQVRLLWLKRAGGLVKEKGGGH